MAKSVAQKMGIRANMRAFLLNAPESALEALELPDLVVSSRLEGNFDYLHLFTTTREEMNEVFPRLKAHLEPSGTLWVSWPKNKQLETDLTLPKVIEIGYNHGLVESKSLSVNVTWSALKFTHPKQGKSYNNSFGRLPDA
jgi:hypothetical protein